MYYEFSCPKCGEPITAEVDVGEHMVDWSEICENVDCQHEFTEAEKDKIYESAIEDSLGSMIDSQHDLMKDS